MVWALIMPESLLNKTTEANVKHTMDSLHRRGPGHCASKLGKPEACFNTLK